MSVSKVRSLERETVSRCSLSVVEPTKPARATRSLPWREPLQRGDAEGAQTLGGLGADAGDEARRGLREALARLLDAHRHEAARLLEVAAHLGHELVGADADRDAEAGGGIDVVLQAAHGRLRRHEAGEVEVGLIQADLLDHGHGLAHERHHAGRHVAVGGEVGRDEDRVGAQAARPRGRHGRADAEAARLVGRGGDHRTRARSGDDDRLAAQLGAAQELDAGVERVDVQVGNDRAGHSEECPARPG